MRLRKTIRAKHPPSWRAALPLALSLLLIAALSGCGGSGSNNGAGKLGEVDTRAFLIDKQATAFSQQSIIDSAELLSSGDYTYEVRFQLKTPLDDNDEIDILAGEPVSAPNSQKLFVLKKANLTASGTSVFWAHLNVLQVEPPLVSNDLLRTQIRTAAEKGNWEFRHLDKDGNVVSSGFLLPNTDVPLTVTVPPAPDSEGLTPGDQAVGTLKAKVSEMDIQAALPVADTAALGQVQSAHLVVLASPDAAGDATPVQDVPLEFISDGSKITLTSALASDQSPSVETQLQYLAAGIQNGLGFLRLTVLRGGVSQEIQFKVGLSKS